MTSVESYAAYDCGYGTSDSSDNNSVLSILETSSDISSQSSGLQTEVQTAVEAAIASSVPKKRKRIDTRKTRPERYVNRNGQPRIIRRDMRHDFGTMLVNVLNSGDKTFMKLFFEKFFVSFPSNFIICIIP